MPNKKYDFGAILLSQNANARLFVQTKGGVKRACRLVRLVQIDCDANFDFACRDELDVDVLLGERGKESRRNAAV